MKVVIPIKAVGKERPRFHPQFKYAYTPKKTKEFEDTLAQYYDVFKKNTQTDIIQGPVRLYVHINTKIPNSWSQSRKELALSGSQTIRPTRIDSDNILKAIMDALNQVAYEDDCQVSEISFSRTYSEEDQIILEVTPIN